MTECAIGLDLSLTNPAACRIPLDWDCDMRRVEVWHMRTPDKFGQSDNEQALRRRYIAERVASECSLRSCSIAIESLPTRKAFALVPLAQLQGVVRDALLLHDIHTAPQSTARKLFLGNLPASDIKETVRRTVQSFPGCAHWTGDECDAFVAANWLLSELGVPCLMAPRIAKPKPKRARKVK